MAFYENTIVAKQNLAKNELAKMRDRYSDLINNTNGKVIKIEEWGLLNLSKNIRKDNKGFYIHYKFEGDKKTLIEIEKKIKIDNLIIRNLIVKYDKLDTKTEYFKKK